MSDTTDELFGDLRPLLFSIAYRMLGSVGEAEDSVQEAFIRFHRAREDGERVESPKAWLSTVVTRLSTDQLRSARARREQYVGAGLPEPLLTDEGDASVHAEMADSLSLAFLVLLERLSPVERAVLLGGKAPAIPKPLHGREKVARMLLGLTRQAVRHGLRMRRAEVNGHPGATLHSSDGRLISVLALDIAEGRVQGIRSMLNPDKLGHLGPLADANELLRSRRRG